ncbi:hypothetical protein [Sulfurivermis fontis]|jgi:hypothetical protein|uniref:hypothetical protein n=1 Tax=Sulfurivermis fontis TaxID=1972068 RepID=UPI000FDBF1DB|nr:hypothetical protein [Sulfurivermis fontis]
MSDYLQQYNAPLTGLLHWEQWDALLAALRGANDGGWYAYYVGEEVPTTPLSPAHLDHLIGELDRLLRRDHQESYLGIVYVDDTAQPTFIKVYDPNHLGSSCGSGTQRVLPGWILSRCPPVDLHAAVANPGGRRRWWHSLFT